VPADQRIPIHHGKMKDNPMTTNLNLQVETLRELSDLATRAGDAAGKVALVPIPKHPRGNYLLVDANGSSEEQELPLPPRATALASVDQVGLHALHALREWGARPAIYYAPSGLTVQLEDGTLESNHGRALCPLAQTKVWELLALWEKSPNEAWKAHKEFFRMLRVTFGDSFESDALARLVESIGQLDFIQGERVQSVQVRNRESMGREVASEVKSLKGDIPEEILLSVRLYRDPVLLRRHSIRCLLETDPQNGRLALLPIAGQLDEALDREMSALGDMLRSSVGASRRLTGPALDPDDVERAAALATEWQIPVFYGQP
jgi:hypothetical protein